jgi:hypothetical protein
MPDDTEISRTAEPAPSARSDGDNESVFSDSEEEEGEILVAKRDAASDEEDAGPQDEDQAAETGHIAGEGAGDSNAKTLACGRDWPAYKNFDVRWRVVSVQRLQGSSACLAMLLITPKASGTKLRRKAQQQPIEVLLMNSGFHIP